MQTNYTCNIQIENKNCASKLEMLPKKKGVSDTGEWGGRLVLKRSGEGTEEGRMRKGWIGDESTE